MSREKQREKSGFWLIDWNRASRVYESSVTCPMLVISGSEDRITLASVVEKVADKYKHVSEYKKFKNHAHWIIGEPGWDEVAGFISTWLHHVLEKR
ncbi:MAG: alpha/beta hydrolase [Syntrophales bacterium]|nr:alpha/beta hydrolase [Syntrophales bacterium]